MANFCIENDKFFDAPEEISSDSECTPEGSEGCSSELQRADIVLNSFHYDFWAENPRSVDERRDEFIRQTGFVLERCHTAKEGPDNAICDDIKMGIDGIVGTSESVLRTVENGENDVAGQTHKAANEGDDLLWRIRNLDDGREYDVDEVDCNGVPRRLHEVGLNTRVTIEEFQRTIGSSNLVQQITRRSPNEESDMVDFRKQQGDGGWLKRFSNKASTMFRKQGANKKLCNYQTVFGSGSQRVRVRSHKKWSKELSSLYRKQNFPAHKGSILAMKFSLDGQHLATGAEDGSLHIWQVIEDERSTDFDILSFIPTSTCLYFSVNGMSNLASFLKIKDEGSMFNKLKSDSACIMVPRKVFRISEKPLHELYGHEGEILDISWSKQGHLLSSSVDMTVRLWQVGCDQCLRVFPHNDYVTCAQFNPVDDNYFISGSIDGIVRIWEVLGCKVVCWNDIKEIVTAICYRPDGKGGIAGSMAGNCCFLEITGNCLEQDFVLYFRGKKNITCKRITGFQFCPSDPSKVIVSSAESHVRMLRGADVICKFRGPRPLDLGCGGSQIFASFTSDGKHIISATDDSDVCIWNHIDDGRITNCKAKNIWSCESFSSHSASIAVPWHGIKSSSEGPLSSTARQHSQPSHNINRCDENIDQESAVPSSEFYSLNHGFSPSTSIRSTAPPEDYSSSLSTTVILPTVGKVDYEFLRNVCDCILSGSSMWGLVIVTGGKDGRIRTFHNYGLPVRYPKRKSFSFSALTKRCTENCSKLRSKSSN